MTKTNTNQTTLLLRFARIVAVAVIASLGLACLLSPSGSEGMAGLAVGQPAPPIQAAGWLNGEPPTPENLAGKVIVVDAWASWCGPCRMHMPKLIDTWKKYRDRDVVFIGLTSEDEEDLSEIEGFLDELNVPWLNGYGASETLMALEAVAIPAMWVIDTQGTVVWNSDSRESMESAIDRALAARK